MKATGTLILLFLVVAWTAVRAADFTKLQDEKREPFDKDDPVQKIFPELNNTIKASILEKLGNDTAAQNLIKDAPVEVIAYRLREGSGAVGFFKVKVASYFFHLRIHRNFSDKFFLKGVRGPLDDSIPMEYFDATPK